MTKFMRFLLVVCLTAFALAAVIQISRFMLQVLHLRSQVSNISPPLQSDTSAFPKWTYASFEWHDMEFDRVNHPNEVRAAFLDFPDDPVWTATFATNGLEMLSLDDVLRENSDAKDGNLFHSMANATL